MKPAEAHRRLAAEEARLRRVRAVLESEGLADASEEESLSELADLDQHEADVATEAFERERVASLLEQVDAELADLRAARRRLADGTYGTCEACGTRIPDERLEALPTTRFCLAHQAEWEGGMPLRVGPADFKGERQ